MISPISCGFVHLKYWRGCKQPLIGEMIPTSITVACEVLVIGNQLDYLNDLWLMALSLDRGHFYFKCLLVLSLYYSAIVLLYTRDLGESSHLHQAIWRHPRKC